MNMNQLYYKPITDALILEAITLTN